MSMSLDGFIAGPGDDAQHGLGRDGHRLHDWLADGGGDPSTYRPEGPSAQVFDEMLATGAVLAGRRTFDFAGGWTGDHHDGVPIFVPTHHPPALQGRSLRLVPEDGWRLQQGGRTAARWKWPSCGTAPR